MKIMAIAIEKELFKPPRVNINPIVIPNTTNKDAKSDNLLKNDLVIFILYIIIKIRQPILKIHLIYGPKPLILQNNLENSMEN